jgi:uncharacterized Zn-finger protein
MNTLDEEIEKFLYFIEKKQKQYDIFDQQYKLFDQQYKLFDPTVENLGIMQNNTPNILVDPNLLQENKYECKVCLKKLKTKGNLQRHEQIHNKNRKKFLCDTCPSYFYRRYSLTKHKCGTK